MPYTLRSSGLEWKLDMWKLPGIMDRKTLQL